MDDDLSWNRQHLVAEIIVDARRTADLTGREVFSERILGAFGTVPREKFVPEGARRNAYANQPLSIGHGQTISQPYIAALMTDLLNLRSVDRVLEVGTGCGYKTAFLADLAAHVLMVELIPELQTDARDRLKALGYGNISFRLGDGWRGWPKEAPFDAVIVTAAPATSAARADSATSAQRALTGSRGPPAIPYPYSAPGRQRA